MTAFKIFDNDIDFETLQEYLSCEAIAVDTETMGLIPRRDRCFDDTIHVSIVL